jgi:hypothetical protein
LKVVAIFLVGGDLMGNEVDAELGEPLSNPM